MKNLVHFLLFLCLALPLHGKTRVACIGNSITYGMGTDNPATDSYPAQLAALLGDDYEVGNFGKSRSTLLSKGHFPYFDQEEYLNALAFKGDIALIHLGVNDTDPRNWPNYGDDFVKEYVALINELKAVNPTCRVIIAKLSPLTARHHRFKSGTRDWRIAINAAIENVARATGAELIDFGEPLRDRQNLIPDAVHPNTEGSSLLARTAYSAITGDYGGLTVPEVYGNRMVLQRDTPLKINGKANAGQEINVEIAGQKARTVADNRGRWSVELAPMTAATGLQMTVASPDSTIVISDIAIGEVWLASGQSNMEFKLQASAEWDSLKSSLSDSGLRLFNMQPCAVTNAREWAPKIKERIDRLDYYLPTSWAESSPESAAGFSAVAWNYGKMLRDSLQVPVGIICNAIGGSGTEAWIDIESLEQELPEALVDWTKNDYTQPWAQGRAMQNMGQDASHRHPYEPSYLFASGIRPLAQFPIKGIIWYQGESNAHNIELHEKLFQLFADSWRKNWNAPELPVLFVQLSSLNRPSWPRFRDSQRRLAEKIPGVAMAVSSDFGDSLDVHPRHKLPIGRRLGRLALHNVYGHSSLTPQGPELRACRAEGGKVILDFNYSKGLASSDNKALRTFEVAEIEGLWHPATAIIKGESIELTSPAVKNPRYVRYGWQPFTRANLVNGEGLPCSTFTTKVD